MNNKVEIFAPLENGLQGTEAGVVVVIDHLRRMADEREPYQDLAASQLTKQIWSTAADLIEAYEKALRKNLSLS